MGPASGSGSTGRGAPAASSGGAASAALSGAGLTGAAAHAARKEVGRIEARLARIEAEQTALHEAMAVAHTDHEHLLALAGQDADLVAERTTLEERWLELAEALEP
jgi:ATP-binding cassette subfamily F protein uup